MISMGILLLVTLIILLTSFRRLPGIGIVVALLIIAITIWLRGDGLAGLGFLPLENWTSTILWSIFLGLVIQLLSTLVIEPFSDMVTKSKTDHSMFDGLRGNLKSFLLMLMVVWVVVAFVEEVIFRGYMMGEIITIFGDSKPVVGAALVLTSVIFGLAHWYQGRSGALSTGIIGFMMGLIFIYAGYNLWLPILTHGFIDTAGLFLIYANLDKTLQERIKIFK
jgi:uncharacterized protein